MVILYKCSVVEILNEGEGEGNFLNSNFQGWIILPDICSVRMFSLFRIYRLDPVKIKSEPVESRPWSWQGLHLTDEKGL